MFISELFRHEPTHLTDRAEPITKTAKQADGIE